MASRDTLSLPDRPTLTKFADVPHVVWGDDESGRVNDLFYVLSEGMVFVTITLAPGAFFQSSDKYRPIFDTHECLYVLEGEYTVQNPETGEVLTARKGEAVFMPEKVWHYGHNFGTEDLRLLECIAPPSDASVMAHVARPEQIVGVDPAVYSDFRVEAKKPDFHLLSQKGAKPAILGEKNPTLFRVFASTERVMFAEVVVRPNSRSDTISFPHDVCYHGGADLLHIGVAETGDYFPIAKGDVVFLPPDTPHMIYNHSGKTSEILLGGAGSFGAVKTEPLK